MNIYHYLGACIIQKPGRMTTTNMVVYMIALVLCIAISHSEARKNVLFLVSDDMRPQINAYEGQDFPSPIHPKMETPHLDTLAAKSLLLKRAYVQQAVCSPSRTSLLTGRRPDTTHVYDLYHYFRNVGGNYTTLPEYFKQNGYTSVGMGKIFHPGHASDYDDPPSWSESYFHAPNLQYWDTKNVSWLAVDKATRAKKPLPDEQTAAHAIKTMRRLAKNHTKPFFLAVGFHKPHLPFVFPEEFLEFYPESDVKLPPNPYAPTELPQIAWYNYPGLRSYHDIKALHMSGKMNTTLPSDVVLKLRRAYYSALSFTDYLIGTVLKELKELGIEKNTIVSFWGDHGWQLGEHGEWCKQTNFELATHAPMMIHIPGLTDEGIVTEKLTEYVDLFPTLVEAAELPPLPLCPREATTVKLCREGTSLFPLIKDPKNANWKDRVFSQYPREGDHMGYTMRTDRYRYTEWVQFSGPPDYKPFWDKNAGVELYDHSIDPEENHNYGYDDGYKSVLVEMSQKLHDGWRAAIPKTEGQMSYSYKEDVLQKINMKFRSDTNEEVDFDIL